MKILFVVFVQNLLVFFLVMINIVRVCNKYIAKIALMNVKDNNTSRNYPVQI